MYSVKIHNFANCSLEKTHLYCCVLLCANIYSGREREQVKKWSEICGHELVYAIHIHQYSTFMFFFLPRSQKLHASKRKCVYVVTWNPSVPRLQSRVIDKCGIQCHLVEIFLHLYITLVNQLGRISWSPTNLTGSTKTYLISFIYMSFQH